MTDPAAELPADLLDHLARVWPDRQTVSNLFFASSEALRDQPAALDHIERDVRVQLVGGAVYRGLVLLTDSGPVWTYQPGMVRQPNATPDRRERPWKRGDEIPNQLGYLICRIHADAIPPMPKEMKLDVVPGG